MTERRLECAQWNVPKKRRRLRKASDIDLEHQQQISCTAITSKVPLRPVSHETSVRRKKIAPQRRCEQPSLKDLLSEVTDTKIQPSACSNEHATIDLTDDRTESTWHVLEKTFHTNKKASNAVINGNIYLKRWNVHDEHSGSRPSAESWANKHMPTTLTDLCMHKKKANEIKQWICTRAANLYRSYGAVQYDSLLILAGPSGSAKSTAVCLIASALRMHVITWDECASVAYSKNVPYESRIQQFHNFILQSRRFNGILHNQQETLMQSECLEKDHSGNEELFDHMIDDIPLADRKLIVIEELPNVANDAMKRELNEILAEAAMHTRFPIVLLLTTNTEQHVKYQYDSSISPSLMRSPFVHIINTNPVNATELKKALNRVASLERVAVDANFLQSIVDTCRGDVRSAITSLEVHCIGQCQVTMSSIVNKRSKNVAKTKMISNFSLLGTRDEVFSVFHALGRIFYKKSSSEDFDASSLVERAGISSSLMTDYLQHNFLSFIGDIPIEVYGLAACDMSTADVLEAAGTINLGNSVVAFPEDYGLIIACESVSACVKDSNIQQNKQPGRTTFKGPLEGALRRRLAAFEHNIDLVRSSSNLHHVLGAQSRRELAIQTFPLLTKVHSIGGRINITPEQLRFINDFCATYSHHDMPARQLADQQQQYTDLSANVQRISLSTEDTSELDFGDDPLLHDDIDEDL